jgi:hypothetical protein
MLKYFCKSIIPSIIGLPASWNVNCQAKGASFKPELQFHLERLDIFKDVYVKLLKILVSNNDILNKTAFRLNLNKTKKKTKTEITDMADPNEAILFQPKNASGYFKLILKILLKNGYSFYKKKHS